MYEILDGLASTMLAQAALSDAASFYLYDVLPFQLKSVVMELYISTLSMLTVNHAIVSVVSADLLNPLGTSYITIRTLHPISNHLVSFHPTKALLACPCLSDLTLYPKC
jgi:hypothetical protein